MEFALRLYTILDSMYTFIRSAQILNTVHQSYQMVIYLLYNIPATSLLITRQGLPIIIFEPPANHLHTGLHTTLLLSVNKMKPFCLCCLCNVFLIWLNACIFHFSKKIKFFLGNRQFQTKCLIHAVTHWNWVKVEYTLRGRRGTGRSMWATHCQPDWSVPPERVSY